MLVIVWAVHLYGRITSVSYCMVCASIRLDNQGKLLHVFRICTGR